MTTFSERVQAGGDDGNNGTAGTGQSHLTLGVAGSATRCWVRFPSVTIPQGATITSASVRFTSDGSSTLTTVSVVIGCEAADDTSTSPTASAIGTKTMTTNTTAWSNIGSWALDTGYDSPDFAASVQEVTDRAGWASGNALAVMVDNNGGTRNRSAYPYDTSTTKAPLLTITYTVITASKKVVTETLSIAGTQVRKGVSKRVISQTEGLAETSVRKGISKRVISQTLGLLESRALKKATKLVVSKTLGIVESTTILRHLALVVTATLGLLATSIARPVAAGIQIAINEVVGLVASSATASRLVKVISDTLSLAGTTARKGIAKLVVTSSEGLIETNIRARRTWRVVSNTLRLAETSARARVRRIVVGSVVGLLGDSERLGTSRQTISETEGLLGANNQVYGLKRVISATLSLAGTLVKVPGKVRVVNATFSLLGATVHAGRRFPFQIIHKARSSSQRVLMRSESTPARTASSPWRIRSRSMPGGEEE